MIYRIKSVSVVRYPVLKVTFTDDYSGEYDLAPFINDGPLFKPLKDKDYFNQVAVGDHGHNFGWNLNSNVDEIDFCPDATRYTLETNAVRARADAYRARTLAAE